jgi:hypothetical protein
MNLRVPVAFLVSAIDPFVYIHDFNLLWTTPKVEFMKRAESLPKTIGKYQIEDVLGEGAMGIVFKGFDPHIRREVAIKLIHRELLASSSGEEVSMRFRLEAQAAGRFSPHVNIVTVYEYGEEEGCPYIVMEYVKGKTLKEWLDSDTHFPLPNACNIMGQLLNGLHYSHANHVVHRDIKPENLFLLDNGQIKISDFGIAKIDKTSLTQHDMRIGTPSYMSPEQIEGKPVDGRSDLFSAGVIFYQLLTGRKPFTGGSLATLMHQVVNTEPPSVLELNSTLPRAFDGLMRKALAKQPENRFQSGLEFAKAIKALEDQASQPAQTKRTGPAARYVLLAALAVMLVAAGASYWYLGRDVDVQRAGSGAGVEMARSGRGQEAEKASPAAKTDGGPRQPLPETASTVASLPATETEVVSAGKTADAGAAAVPRFDSRVFFTSTDGVMKELQIGDKLTPADTYYISFRTPAEVILYIAQVDSRGDIYPIFPNSQLSGEKNPLDAGRDYKFPEKSNFFLDFNTGKEHIYFVAAAKPNADIEGIFKEIMAADDARKRELARKFVAVFESIDPANTRSVWFWHM